MSPSTTISKLSPITFIAAGRLGSSLASALNDNGYNVAAVTSRRPEHREWLSARVTHSLVTGDTQTAVNLADIVFITGPDDAIAEICSAIDWRQGQAVIHCAGVLPLNSLRSSAEQGASVGGFHPLQTFPSPDSSNRLGGVSFAIEANESELNTWLRHLALNLGGSSIQIGSDQRAAYHASAVMACGLLAGLAGLAAEMWAPLAIDRGEALKRLIPLIRATVDALDQKGLPSAMTGPFVRGDTQTVDTHLASIRSISNDVAQAYAALGKASIHIAQEQGGLSDQALGQITSALSGEN